MNKQIALKLKEKVQEIAVHFSNPNREFNGQSETFEVREIIPLSEATAVAVFDKSSGKRALAFLYWVRGNGGYWTYFFPTDSHLVGLNKLSRLMQKIEEFNFVFNFEEKKLEEFI